VSFLVRNCFEITCPVFSYNDFPMITGGYCGKTLKKEISTRYLRAVWDSDPPSALHFTSPYSRKGSGHSLGLYLPLKDKFNPL
jgi:hypothetical protein